MKKSDRYHKWVEWSEEDGAYLGKCPDLITGIHGDDPKKVYADLCEVIEDVIAHFESAPSAQSPAYAGGTVSEASCISSRHHLFWWRIGLSRKSVLESNESTTTSDCADDADCRNLPPYPTESSMTVTHPTSRHWFEDAERCYVEHHQGCPWCAGSHRVHRISRGQKHTYACQSCDFQVTLDLSTGKYCHIVGENLSRSSVETMHDQ